MKGGQELPGHPVIAGTRVAENDEMEDPADGVHHQEKNNHHDAWKEDRCQKAVQGGHLERVPGVHTSGKPVPGADHLVLPVVQLLLVVLAEDVEEQEHDEAKT